MELKVINDKGEALAPVAAAAGSLVDASRGPADDSGPATVPAPRNEPRTVACPG